MIRFKNTNKTRRLEKEREAHHQSSTSSLEIEGNSTIHIFKVWRNLDRDWIATHMSSSTAQSIPMRIRATSQSSQSFTRGFSVLPLLSFLALTMPPLNFTNKKINQRIRLQKIQKERKLTSKMAHRCEQKELKTEHITKNTHRRVAGPPKPDQVASKD